MHIPSLASVSLSRTSRGCGMQAPRAPSDFDTILILRTTDRGNRLVPICSLGKGTAAPTAGQVGAAAGGREKPRQPRLPAFPSSPFCLPAPIVVSS